MAFGFEYWMVYLPDIEAASFLLFVHNPAGATKLRNYASGRARVVGQPDVSSVYRETSVGSTRHACDEHKTDDHGFWHQKTIELNRRYLGTGDAKTHPLALQPAGSSPRKGVRVVQGRARRGSQRQLQDYVNDRPEELSLAVLDMLPSQVREFGAQIRWVSPLARDAYREYRDADFLTLVGLGDRAKALAEFWPSMGPSWDALGIISDPGRRMKPGVILVEAKSHIPEIYGSGCQASPASLVKIESAIGQAQSWCGVSTNENWFGPLYQYANRIAHLYWLYDRLRTPVWLVNLYFTGDPIGPSNRSEWEREVAGVKARLGLTRPVPNMIEVFLPALTGADVNDSDDFSEEPALDRIPHSPISTAEGFDLWAQRWMAPARFSGAHLPEPAERIQQVLALWDAPVPGNWARGIDNQLLGTRYRRGDYESPHLGEHTVEHEILTQLEEVRCLDGSVVDGINAMPLSRDEKGGRRGNVEGDLFLLVKKDGQYQLVVCEVKHSANTCWYAAIESLRQLKLLHLSTAARQLFHLRNPGLCIPAEIPVIGLVVAPEEYYTQRGQKGNALSHTLTLLSHFRDKTRIEAHLAVWDLDSRSIRKLRSAGSSRAPANFPA